MSFYRIGLIFQREVLDQLRDRRTLFMILVLPILLYPALGVGMMQMMVVFSEQPRTVVILNAKDLPPPSLLDGNRFAKAWFHPLRDHQDKLAVVTDLPPAPGAVPPTAETQARRDQMLKLAEEIRALVQKRSAVEEVVERERLASSADPEKLRHHQALSAELRQQLGEKFTQSKIQVLIVVPEGFRENVQRVNEQLGRRQQGGNEPVSLNYERPLLIQNKADEKSTVTYNRVIDVMDSWEREILRGQLAQGGLPEQLPTPVKASVLDLSDNRQLANNVWSKLFPAMLILMAVTGAFYPAIDLAAGEKERGTMETLLICPAQRTEIVLGKFLTVMLFSMATALLNLASLGFTGKYISSLATQGMTRSIDLSLPPLSSLIWVIIVLIPLAALFSALCLALATFARSSKEGQYYLTPLLMVTLGLNVFCLSPAVEMQPFYSILPVVGPALLLKSAFLTTTLTATFYVYAVTVLVSSAAYSLLALWWAIDQFSRESVLFREAERFELTLWLKHLMRDKEATPSFTEAGVCFVLILLLQFLALRVFQTPLQTATGTARETLMMQLLIIQQLAIIATPPLLMGIMLTTNVRRTFQFYWPRWQFVAVSLVLAVTLMPLSYTLGSHLKWFFPPPPPGAAEVMRLLASGEQPLWLMLLAFAVAPGICEEIAFRGFILSGFRHRGRTGLAITLSAIAFGVIHMIPQQVFNAALLGLVIGLVAVQSRSILPGILFHIFYNGSSVVVGKYAESWAASPYSPLRITGEELAYREWFLVPCAVVAMAGLVWLVRQSPQRHAADAPLPPDAVPLIGAQ